MNYDHDEAQRVYRNFKMRLTRAINKKDNDAILAEARRFSAYYAESAEPMPDNWSRWQRAADDAVYALQREGKRVEMVVI